MILHESLKISSFFESKSSDPWCHTLLPCHQRHSLEGSVQEVEQEVSVLVLELWVVAEQEVCTVGEEQVGVVPGGRIIQGHHHLHTHNRRSYKD